MKILYFANVAAQYRLEFFYCMQKKSNIKFVITHQYKNNLMYDFGDSNYNFTNFIFLKKNILSHYFNLLKILINEEFDCCMVPPLDSIREIIDVYIIILISKIRKKKCIYFWEKWQPEKNISPIKVIKNRIQKYVFSIIKNSIDYVLVPGKKGEKYFENYLKYPKDKIKNVINTSVINEKNKKNNIRKKYNIDDEKKIILYFGRIIRVKGLDILIKAFNNMVNKDKACLLICGDGEFKQECLKLIKNSKNIIFTGKVNSSERYDYFFESNIFVLPSRNDNGFIEAWGLTVAEAMDLGLACVVSDMVGCSSDLIKDNLNGLIFESENFEELSQKLDYLIENNDFRHKIAKSANETIKNKYNYEKMSESFLEIFNNIL